MCTRLKASREVINILNNLTYYNGINKNRAKFTYCLEYFQLYT